MYTKEDLHVERIEPNPAFMEENLAKVKHLFDVAVLPELLGRWFSRPTGRIALNSARESSPIACTNQSAQTRDTDNPELEKTKTYCYCKQGEHGKMIGCDNASCDYQWFHLDCLKLKSFPKSSKWYCPDCRKLHRNKYKSLS